MIENVSIPNKPSHFGLKPMLAEDDDSLQAHNAGRKDYTGLKKDTFLTVSTSRRGGGYQSSSTSTLAGWAGLVFDDVVVWEVCTSWLMALVFDCCSKHYSGGKYDEHLASRTGDGTSGKVSVDGVLIGDLVLLTRRNFAECFTTL